MTTLLEGGCVIARGVAGGPAHRAARELRRLGALVELEVGGESLAWRASPASEVAFGEVHGPIEAQYAALLGAIRLLEGGGMVDPDEVKVGLTEGMIEGPDAPVLVRCRDGWLVARWRDRTEMDLLEAMLGKKIGSSTRADCWAAARQCRLLVAPVMARPRSASRPSIGVDVRDLPVRAASRLRVVDWTSLWAGPWASAQLADRGAAVVRVDVAQRPDGLSRTAEGRSLLARWNRSKVPVDGDARTPEGLRRLRRAISTADLLITNTTPRVLPQLGFDDEWFRTAAPHVSLVSIVAYEDPYAEAPGLGEQAAAVAGLLHKGAGQRPDEPRPWADPLAGAEALLLVRAWERAGRPRGLDIRVSLEGAASAAMSPAMSAAT